MPALHRSDRDRPADRPDTRTVDQSRLPPDGEFEALHVRNYDVADAHTVTVDVTDTTGVPVFKRRYHLRPGQTRSVAHDVPPGTYDVVVEVDAYDRETRRVDVGPDPAETALVELGNGITSVSQGLY